MNDNPYKPFRVRFVNRTVYDIHEPWIVIIGQSSAVIVTQVREDDHGYETADDWRTVSISHMLEFSDLEPKKRERKRA